MKRKTLTSAAHALSLLLLATTCALAQEREPLHLSGLINDYSPSTVKMGPWEMHGQWSMDLHDGWINTADFLADMTMSDYGTSGVFDATQAEFTGTVTLVTGNGTPAPFETTPPSSTLHVCVSGGTEVPYSNITMQFVGPATTHFGSQAIHGVVRKATPEPIPDRDRR